MRYHYEIQLSTENDRNLLLTLKDKNHANFIEKGENIIYIYSLVDLSIQYPNKAGKILYIGEACKKAQPTGLRFSQHIASKENEGRNRNVNYTLHRYYWNGVKLAVDIFNIGKVTQDKRKEIERELINCHIKIYGALPIAQGTSGVLVDNINNVDETKANKYFKYTLD